MNINYKDIINKNIFVFISNNNNIIKENCKINNNICKKYNLKLTLLNFNNIDDYITIDHNINNINTELKMNILKYYILHKYGGVWLKENTMIIKNFNKIINNKEIILEDNNLLFLKNNSECSNFCIDYIEGLFYKNKIINFNTIELNKNLKINFNDKIENIDNIFYKNKFFFKNYIISRNKSLKIFNNYYFIKIPIIYKYNNKELFYLIYKNKKSIIYNISYLIFLNKITDNNIFLTTKNKQIKIIQASPDHTGSTLLLNLIHGFLSPDEGTHWNTESLIDKYLITKTHNTNIDMWEKKYPNYKLYFIMSERNDSKVIKLINNKYKNKNNVLIINYNELLETPNNMFDDIICNIFYKLLKFIPNELIPKKNNNLIKTDMINRINFMNNIVKKMENKNFSDWDTFTGIHGGHRNR